jgi:hypothetical protein
MLTSENCACEYARQAPDRVRLRMSVAEKTLHRFEERPGLLRVQPVPRPGQRLERHGRHQPTERRLAGRIDVVAGPAVNREHGAFVGQVVMRLGPVGRGESGRDRIGRRTPKRRPSSLGYDMTSDQGEAP